MPRLPIALLAVPLLACPGDPEPPPTIEPPAGCSQFAFEAVTFEFQIHFGGVDYAQADLLLLLDDAGADRFQFPFGGVVTELAPDPEGGREAITVTETAAEGEPPLDDPNSLRVVYQLPAGHELPVLADQSAGVEVVLDRSSGELLRAFSLWDLPPEEPPTLLFLAEANDLGLAYEPGASHPLFEAIEVLDRNCPTLRPLPCGAERYNLEARFLPRVQAESAPADAVSLWPTDAATIQVDGLDFEVVNTWSFTHRNLEGCAGTGYDYSAERSAWFATRSLSRR